MGQLFSIMKITVGRDKLRARVLVDPAGPVQTSQDIEGTARVYYLAPAIADHFCMGDAGERFRDCMGDTQTAHLLEHLSVEIMRATGLAGTVTCGRTRGIEEDERLYDIELSCPDDALAVGALSSAAFMMDWAYMHPTSAAPDVVGTVQGLRNLVLSLRGSAEQDDVSAEPDTNSHEASAPGSEVPALSSEQAARPEQAEGADGADGAQTQDGAVLKADAGPQDPGATITMEVQGR